MPKVLTLLMVLLLAQQQPPPTFKSGVALVTVDVSVLDKEGRPVEGLGAEDFEVKLDGRVYPVKVASFVQIATRRVASVGTDTITAGGATATSTTAPTSAATPAAPAPAQQGDARVYVILVDDLSFSAMRGKNLFTAADKFVRSLPTRDLVGFTTTSGITTVNPTTDRTPVYDALRRVVGQFTDPRAARPLRMGGGLAGAPDQPVGIMQALNIDRGDLGTLQDVLTNECFGGDRQKVTAQSIPALVASDNCAAAIQREVLRTVALTKSNTARQAQAFASIIDVLRRVPGYKQMIVLTDGLAVGAEVANLKPIAVAAASAGVRVSVLLEDQDLSITDEGRRYDNMSKNTDIGLAQRRREDARLVLQGAQEATTMAGGHFFRITGDPDPFFERAAMAGSAVYRLGLDAPAGSAPARQFELEARVKTRKDLSVAASRVAMVAEPEAPPTPAAALTVDERLKAALGAGRDVSAIPMTVSTALRRAANASSNSALELLVSVEMPAAKGPLVTMFGLVDRQGGMNSGRRELTAPADGSPMAISFLLPMTAGQYRLRFAAADGAGTIGSMEVPVAAELATMGPFLASDLLTASVDAKGQGQFFVTNTLPAGATSLRTSLELYATTTAPVEGVSVQWEITRVGETEPMEDREVTPRATGSVLRAEAEFDRALFTPGNYVLRATVRQGEAVIGRALRNITVIR
jgi:VWFA-related protein